MAKKIVILNGSARSNGNTAALVAEFARGAEESGAEVTRIDLGKLDIHPCLGCCCGGKDENSPCVQKDGMTEIYPAVRDSDVVVLASPLYYWNLSGQLRTCFDRLFALEEGGENLLRGHGRAGALLMAAEGHGFDDVPTYYRHLMEQLRWQDLGQVLAGGNMNAGDIAGKPELEQAYRLGLSIR